MTPVRSGSGLPQPTPRIPSILKFLIAVALAAIVYYIYSSQNPEHNVRPFPSPNPAPKPDPLRLLSDAVSKAVEALHQDFFMLLPDTQALVRKAAVYADSMKPNPSWEIYLLRGLQYLREQNFDAARRFIYRAAEEAPDENLPLYAKVNYDLLYDFESPVAESKSKIPEMLAKAIHRNPDDPIPHVLLGRYYRRLPEALPKALGHFQLALILDNRNYAAIHGAAETLLDLEECDAAAALLQDAITQENKIYQLWFALSRAYICQAQREAALDVLAEACALNPVICTNNIYADPDFEWLVNDVAQIEELYVRVQAYTHPMPLY